MRVVDITEKFIQFSNGKKITFNHMPNCCEHNYADFSQIDDWGKKHFIMNMNWYLKWLKIMAFVLGTETGL